MSVAGLLAFIAVALGAYGTGRLWLQIREAAANRAGAGGGAKAFALTAALGRATGLELSPTGADERLLSSAGVARLTADDLQAARLGLGAIGALLAVALAGRPGGAGLPLAIMLGALTGAALPRAHLRRRSRARAAQALIELPATLDLLRVAVEAGLSPRRALTEVARRGGGVVAEEMQRAVALLELGEPLTAASTELARRLDVPSVALLGAALERSERDGTPLARALEGLAVDVRAGRAVALTERAQRAVPRMQLVIAMVLVPAVLALVAALVVARIA